MDGVIVDSELHWKNLEGFFLSSLVSSWTDADQSRIIGVSMDHVYTLLVSEYGMQKSREQFLAQYQEMANEIYGKKVALLPGVEDLLTKLRQHHIPVALASSSPRSWINIVLRRFNLRASFQAVISADDLNGEGKPSPAIYLFTASSLGVPPTQCIAIEDSKNGVLSAKNAGMFCIGLRNGFNEEQDISRADLIIHGFAELDFNLFLKDY